MKKTVLREYLKNREEKEMIEKTVEKNKLKDFAKMAIHNKMHANPKRVKQKGDK
jgi:hypothetical protein